jgi:formiminoglutamase
MPHTGLDVPGKLSAILVSEWLARKDTDWFIDRLYDFAPSLGATLVRTGLSRTVIDVNRDPSGASLYPGQPTTELCPTTTFDGEPLYSADRIPDAAEIAARRARFFEPYHHALATELARLRREHDHVVLYDCHSIRSVIPRLFTGELPHFNLGTNNGGTCDPALTSAIEAICDATSLTRVTNGRFKGGYTTRHYGRPRDGVHAIQMELACRGYLREPSGAVSPNVWPVTYDEAVATPLRKALVQILQVCIEFCDGGAGRISRP